MAKKSKIKKQASFTNPDQNMQPIDITEIAGDGFGKYAEYVIIQRSLPDVRDGLIPVQRRNLFGMHKRNWSSKKPYVKSAKIVGEVMGSYHPHGDSAIYGALARMSKEWLMGIPMVDMSGNNGSIDGDSEAAMRYTESRLSSYSEDLLLSNLSLKGIVPEKLNYDDTLYEPIYLPAKVPNILINGSEGIAVGYASNIPTFNLNEVLDACIAELRNPNIEDSELITYIPAPDFSTGGTIADYKSYADALISGRGGIKVRGNYTIEEDKKNKEIHIIFHEIPYGSVKPKIINTVIESINNKEISGIKEIRDDSDLDTGVSLVVSCNESANIDGILSFLFSKTDLQRNVPLNITAISKNKPKVLGVTQIIRDFNVFRKETFIRGLQIQIKELEFKAFK